MKRIDWLVVGYYSLIGAVVLFYVVIFAFLLDTPSDRASDPITTEAWRQIAIRQSVRASVAEMYLRRCQDAPMMPIKCPSDQTDGELQSVPLNIPSDIAMVRREASLAGNPSSSALASEDEPAGNRSEIGEDGPEREPVTADTKGQPTADEASRRLYKRLSDRAKEGTCCVRVNVTARLRYGMDGPVIGAEAAPTSPSSLTVNSPTAQSSLIPCRVPIAIGRDGRLLEPCDALTGKPIKETSWTTSATANILTVSVPPKSPATALSAGIAEAASTSSLHRPSAQPEAPVVCASDALGPVTTLWNKVSVDWYRASLAYPRDKQLPWLFQCRGDLAQLAAADAAKDPAAAADLMAWLLTWLLDHGVISRESYAWHHFTVVRPQEAAGVTEVTVRFDVWESRGEIDRDGMNGEVLADPDCTECEIWYWAPMVPGTASVVKWGTR